MPLDLQFHSSSDGTPAVVQVVLATTQTGAPTLSARDLLERG